jgi:hypothetical protein
LIISMNNFCPISLFTFIMRTHDRLIVKSKYFYHDLI